MNMDPWSDVNCNEALFCVDEDCDGWFVSAFDCIIEVNWDQMYTVMEVFVQSKQWRQNVMGDTLCDRGVFCDRYKLYSVMDSSRSSCTCH